MDAKKEVISKLQQDILLWQGFRPQPEGGAGGIGLGRVEQAFPNGVFPQGALHEFVALKPEHSAACGGFIGGLLACLMKEGAPCVWVGTARKLFPLALSAFNVQAERIIFMDAASEKDALWIVEEALKCEGLAAVVAEIGSLNLSESRRLQLAVEQSGVTGFILRKDAGKKAGSIATARWLIRPAPSHSQDHLPGIGFPRWHVELLKVRNGLPGQWTLEWAAGEFAEVMPEETQRQAPGYPEEQKEQRQTG